ncbi:MAG: M24 family metallopeptidase [Gammaproteobacteria bacterium]|nr:M24 family metallopeptidase [Gammaproteobacteria bacterium]
MKNLLLVLLASISPAATIASETPSANQRPNIVWIVGDDLGVQIAPYGDAGAVTPTLDQIAKIGTRFSKTFAASPTCSPSRSALITSRYPTEIGTHHHRSRLTTSPQTMLELLAAASNPFDPPAMRYNRNLVRKGARLSDRDRFQLALAAEFADKPAASALHAVRRALTAAGVGAGRVGFDDVRVYPWLRDLGLPDLKGVDAADIFKEVRMVKSVNEIEVMREVSRRCESALDAAIASLHVGQAISEVEIEYRKRIGALGGDTRWLIINQDGLNSGRIERDKVIKIDSVGDYLGYVGDIGRSIVVGTPTDEVGGRNAANAKALRTAYAAIRPGMPFGEASRIVGDVMRQEGYNGFGAPHNVGMDHTDQPNSLARPGARGEPPRFEVGSVFTLDVPYLEIGYGSSHVEDMMVCTPSGAVPLSSGQVELRVLRA